MKNVLVMGRLLKISDVAHREMAGRAGSASNIGQYLTNIFEKKWQSKNKYSLAEILQAETNVLANE